MIRQNLAQFSKMCFEVISVKNVQTGTGLTSI